ncbi:NADPH-dependent fmn reductase [Candidatus Magnetoovum chiemensis]|nr:NADPH-dependent fmn reductase [Candidatus Magnetoovum chiemensis]
MKIVAFLGSPRVNGNSEILLKEALRAVSEQNHEITLFRPSTMKIAPCANCGGCEKTGECVIKDEMQQVYDAIKEGERFILVSPVFFFGLPSQIKALIDRCQAIWSDKYLLNKSMPETSNGREGLVVTVGGMKKQVGFECSNSCATAFFRTISVQAHEHLFFKDIDAKGAILEHPDMIEQVYKAAKKLGETS